jgi:uncharacterized OB-fold protein
MNTNTNSSKISQPWVFQNPLQNIENSFFWAQAQDKKLVLKHCLTCDASHYYPRSYCPHCGSEKTQWRASKGEGEVYSFTCMVRGVEKPFLMAYVLLDEGVQMLTHLQTPHWETVSIGMRVRVDFAASASGQNVPIFIPQ